MHNCQGNGRAAHPGIVYGFRSKLMPALGIMTARPLPWQLCIPGPAID
jgi:hypothetical protein